MERIDDDAAAMGVGIGMADDLFGSGLRGPNPQWCIMADYGGESGRLSNAGGLAAGGGVRRQGGGISAKCYEVVGLWMAFCEVASGMLGGYYVEAERNWRMSTC